MRNKKTKNTDEGDSSEELFEKHFLQNVKPPHCSPYYRQSGRFVNGLVLCRTFFWIVLWNTRTEPGIRISKQEEIVVLLGRRRDRIKRRTGDRFPEKTI